MGKSMRVYGRKLFSLALIFNSLLTIACATGLLHGVYANNWKPYTPYLVDGNLLWLMIASAAMNIFPAALIGKVHTGRLWFHHYVYGLTVLAVSCSYIVLFTPIPLLNLFTISTADFSVNVGRFFVLGGITLLLDDFADVSTTIGHNLALLKSKVYQVRKAINIVQFVLGAGAAYILLTISAYLIQSPNWATIANLIVISSLTITVATSFMIVKQKIWYRLKTEEQTQTTE